MKEIAFYTHANNKIGFGHLARCMNLSRILLKNNSKIKIYFIGKFTKNIKLWVSSEINVNFSLPKKEHLAIYDRMDDKENPEKIDVEFIKKILARSKHLILFANGRKIIKNKILSNSTIIGYKIGKETSKKPNIFWGLKYAPVNTKRIKIKTRNSVLIALGGNNGNNNVDKLLKAISKSKDIKNIFFLISPVNKMKIKQNLIRKDQKIEFYYKVPKIEFLFEKINLVIASYGHLAYEALAACIPVCLVNQKRFQTIYSEALVKEELCSSAGNLKNITIRTISNSINETIINSDIYIKNNKKKFKDSGLLNVVKIIYNVSQE